MGGVRLGPDEAWRGGGCCMADAMGVPPRECVRRGGGRAGRVTTRAAASSSRHTPLQEVGISTGRANPRSAGTESGFSATSVTTHTHT